MKERETDVLVIGAGGAGTRAAIEASSQGASVIVLSKSLPKKSHTVMAEGGYAAALGNANQNDNWKVHASDTLRDGLFINDYRMSEILAKESIDRLRELEEWGALFDRTENGRIRQRAFGGHSYKRTCHVADQTGLEMVRVLASQAKKRGVEFVGEVFVARLFTDGEQATGALALNLQTGKFILLKANAVILATGGNARIYKISTNPWETTGEGFTMAYEVGAVLRDMEMVQFHPTGMVFPPTAEGVLVTESVRGEGGRLYNADNERFMKKYAPKWMEIAPRDVVARAIWQEVQEGRGTDRGGVYLDITHKDPNFIKTRLTGTHEQFLDLANKDITKERMVVTPTTHYSMGGIRVDAETTETDVKGLYAAGEVTAGVHGANRLGSNSTCDIVVFGRRAGRYAAKYAQKQRNPRVPEEDVEEERKRLVAPFETNGSVKPQSIKREILDTMWEHVGVWRTEEGLKKAKKKIRNLGEKAEKIGVNGNLVYNQEWIDYVDVNSMLLQAEIMIRAARKRKESRGAHYRVDYPDREEEWRAYISVKKGNDNPVLRKKPLPKEPPDWYTETKTTALEGE